MCDAGRRCFDEEGGARCRNNDYVPCDENTFVDRCERNSIVTCWNGEERNQDCGAAQYCVERDVGPRCAPVGTEACDPDSYPPHCDGDFAYLCSPGLMWEIKTDCSRKGSPGIMTCEMFDLPACVPRNYTPCKWFTPECNGNVGRMCKDGHFLVEETCTGANPVCRAHNNSFICSFGAGKHCVYSTDGSQSYFDKFGDLKWFSPLRCFDSSALVVCDQQTGLEYLMSCTDGLRCSDAPEHDDHPRCVP